MSDESRYISIKESLELASTWRDLWERTFSSCENNWHLLQSELERETPRMVDDHTAEDIIPNYQELKKRFGQKTPLVVYVAALFRHEFLRIVALIVPDAGGQMPAVWDAIDEKIARSPYWEGAVQAVLSDIRKVKRAISRAHPELQITAETSPLVLLKLFKGINERRMYGVLRRAVAKHKNPQVQPLSESGYLTVSADRINKATLSTGQKMIFETA